MLVFYQCSAPAAGSIKEVLNNAISGGSVIDDLTATNLQILTAECARKSSQFAPFYTVWYLCTRCAILETCLTPLITSLGSKEQTFVAKTVAKCEAKYKDASINVNCPYECVLGVLEDPSVSRVDNQLEIFAHHVYNCLYAQLDLAPARQNSASCFINAKTAVPFANGNEYDYFSQLTSYANFNAASGSQWDMTSTKVGAILNEVLQTYGTPAPSISSVLGSSGVDQGHSGNWYNGYGYGRGRGRGHGRGHGRR